jgi:hypothetical protein
VETITPERLAQFDLSESCPLNEAPAHIIIADEGQATEECRSAREASAERSAERTSRMSKHHRLTDSKVPQYFHKQFCLSGRRPQARASTLAMPETGSVKTNNTGVACKEIQQSADRKVLDH